MHKHDSERHAVHCLVQLCPNGCVCLGFGPTMVHLQRSDFQSLLRVMSQAAEELGFDARGEALSQVGLRAQH